MTSRVNSETHLGWEQTSLRQRLKRRVSAAWHRSQIGHRSQYSIERLIAFRDYYERTSLARVVAVCFFAPIPALLSALAIDCIPLKPPSEGWQANYAVWIRMFLAMSTEALGVVFQVRAVIEPGTISIYGAVKIALGTGIFSVLTAVMLAAAWKFPTPFGYVLVVSPFVMFFSLFTIFVVGSRELIQSPALRKQFKDQFIIIVSQGVVAVCYPIFSAIFTRLSGIQQTIFIFVMPMIKFCTKQNIANAAKSYHEYVGPVVVFSVDLFNVYYVAICMQTSKSIVTTLIIMTTDTFHVILALRAIFHRRNSDHEPNGPAPGHFLQDIPELLQRLFNDGTSTRRTRHIRLFAPFPLPLSKNSTAFMDELAKSGTFANDKATNRRCSSRAAMKRKSGVPNRVFDSSIPILTRTSSVKQHQIAPATPVEHVKLSTVESPSPCPRDLSKTTEDSISNYDEDVAHDALQTLFHSEYILLAEYIEFIVPMLYAPYLAVLFHLPVAAYYPHTASITEQKLKTTVINIMVYGVIEFVSFGALLVLLKRKFGFSPLYQLAFVLETHAAALQGHLFVWTITILHLTLKHYGVDFNILAM